MSNIMFHAPGIRPSLNYYCTTPHSFPEGITVHVAPEDATRFLEAFKPVFDLVVAEPECLFFEVYRSAEEPGRISWVENWAADSQWLMDVQTKKEYYKDYFAATEPMFVKPREVKLLERMGPDYFMVKEKPFPEERKMLKS
ncbi:hypothetical protein F5Y15DRAFT_410766 [Xylariaceae sp. FL0016]|nr:hypothetical protein F5Y15DRAFT_410766 [Xylariaceae sp. FL0016]